MTPRRRPRDEARRARTDVYRQHIFEAAERVFAERGFESAKLQDISKLAGLSMGTIYAIFPSKGDLHRAILEERGIELLGLVRAVADRPGPPDEALDGLIELYVGWFVEHPGFLRMHLRAGTSWALSPSGTDAQVQHWQDIHALQAEIFRRGIAEGAFVDEEPGYLARLFSVMDQVLLADWVAGGMKASRDELVRRLRAQVARSFARAPVTRRSR
ncbi:MAG TPA: TetR/AcrR family transcriptional regulator [Candidatus Binatia bacterium]|nr:TetR/AcrR family transcriptional regulator [Candidatus Binatia bacterium]